MSAISTPSRFLKPRIPGTRRVALHDVTDRVKTWGRRGIFFGATFGLVFGAIFVAIPFTSDTLAVGAIGALLVGAVECAVIAGGFAALAAAILGNGVRRGSTAQYERILRAGRRPAFDVPRNEWPARWAYPTQNAMRPVPRSPDEDVTTALSLPDVQARLNTIDAWEHGNTGP